MKPGKRGTVSTTAPPILERLNLSAELWLQVVEQFGKRRSASRNNPASPFQRRRAVHESDIGVATRL